MEQLLLIPVCEVHEELKVWYRNKAQKAGGQWKCRRCQKILHDQWKARPGNREKYDEQRRSWAQLNPDKKRLAEKRCRDRDGGQAERERQRERQQANRGRYNFLERRRRARKMGALVSLDSIDSAISVAFYEKATRIGKTVDHIQPLVLGGKHAPWNFQLMSLSENSSKNSSRPTLQEVMRGERRYHLLRRIFERELGTVA